MATFSEAPRAASAPEEAALEGARPVAAIYRTIWRWHFYAGLLVVPIMVILSITGIVYLFRPQLDAMMYGDRMFVAPGGAALEYSRQLDAVKAAYPGAAISSFIPPAAADRSTAVKLDAADGRTLTVWVNPASGQVLGERDEDFNLQTLAKKLHGELLIGKAGDRIVEMAACWGLVLMVSGLYLWWPRKGGKIWGVLLPRLRGNRRVMWRDLHAVPGFYAAFLVIVLIVSGLPWSGFWGEQFAKTSSQFPDGMWENVPTSTKLTGALNQQGDQVVPWAAEQLPLPESTPPAAGEHSGHGGGAGSAAPAAPAVGPDQIVAVAQARNVHPGYSVSLPGDDKGVYTVSVYPNDVSRETTLHIDQYSGAVLLEAGWDDYNLIAKSVETGIALHEGRMFGLANQLLALFAALAVLLLSVSGTVMWWRRRPAGRMGVPPLPASARAWRGAVAIVGVMGLMFPLVGISLVAVLLLDWAVIQRVPALRRALA